MEEKDIKEYLYKFETCIYKELKKERKEKDFLLNELEKYKIELNNCKIELNNCKKDLENYKFQYEVISNSKSWKLTYPLRLALDKIKRLRLLKISDCNESNIINSTNVNIDLSSHCHSSHKDDSESDFPKGYHSIYQDEEIIRINPSVKVLAFNLPQFHAIPENDIWWGKGFTEWTNTKKAVPLYDKHYEPREPHKDLGYYDLSKIETIKKQAEMARRHGLYGFCYYYYWFSGKRLLEKPVDLLLEHTEINIPFCLCWANENWTRTWDGMEKNILIEQKYLNEDAEHFITDISKYIVDHRYIKWHGKSVIVIYAPKSIPNIKNFLEKAKEEAYKKGIGEISFWICKTSKEDIFDLDLDEYIDKEIEFPPRFPEDFSGAQIHVKDVKGQIFDYSKFIDNILCRYDQDKYNFRSIHAVMLGWDSSARRASGYWSFDNFDLRKYYQWLSFVIKETEKKYLPEDRFVFINAWNEWGEGTYLEPDKKYGYSAINTTSKAIAQVPFE